LLRNSEENKIDLLDADILKLAARGFSTRAIATNLSESERKVKTRLKKLDVDCLLPVSEAARYSVYLDLPLYVKSNCVITADWHIPLFDADLVNEMILDAKHAGLKTLVIGGDFFNFDALSQYDPKQNDPDLEWELTEGVATMEILTKTFDEIVYLLGNHDQRLHRSLNYKIPFKYAMSLVFDKMSAEAMEKVYFSNLDFCYIDHGGMYDWRVCHPATYSKLPLAVPRQLAAKFTESHIISAHGHHSAVAYAPDGKRVLVEAGGLHDRTKTAYLQRTTTFPVWQQGYATLIDDKLRVVTPEFTYNYEKETV